MIEVKVKDPDSGRELGTLRLREIIAEVRMEGEEKKTVLRLWTTLLDAKEYPALVLTKLYKERWGVETYFMMLENILKILARRAIIKPRKPRQCQRGVRSPRSSWSKINERKSTTLKATYTITHANP